MFPLNHWLFTQHSTVTVSALRNINKHVAKVKPEFCDHLSFITIFAGMDDF